MKIVSEQALFGPNVAPISFRRLLDSVLDMVCVIDAHGRFVHVNQACLPLLGYHPSEMVGQSLKRFIVREDFEKTVRGLHKVSEGGYSTDFHNRYRHKNGQEVYLVWSGKWDRQDQLFYCVGRDASEQIQKTNLQLRYGQEIERRHAELYDMLERITDGFFAMDAAWCITYINPQVEQMLSIKCADYLGKNYWACFPEMIGSVYHEQYLRASTQKVPVHFEAWFPPFQRWLEVNAYPSDKGLSIFFRDVTEKRQVEQELHKLSLIARNTENMVVITGADRRITWVNEAFTRITGYQLEEVIGQKPGQLLHGPDSDPEVALYIREQIHMGRSFRTEVINYTKQGRKYWSELYCQPVKDGEGRVQQYFSIQTDITERKKLQAQLDKEQRERQQMITAAALKAQESERAQVSRELHDNVNQVLTTVKLYAELCLSGVENQSELLKRSMDLLQQSITEIRSLSKRLSAPSLGSIKMKDSIKELVEAVAATGQLSIVLDTSAVDKLEPDAELHLSVYRILQEHLTNILKHAAAHSVQIGIEVEEGALVLTVTDDGKGFDPQKKSSGIGITNMISRAESQNGSLVISSAPGLGCVLRACFPLIDGA